MIKYIIPLLLLSACSSTKVTTTKDEKPKIHYKNQTDRYLKNKINQRTQSVYI